MNTSFVELHALLATMESSSDALSVRKDMRRWAREIISGQIVVVGAGHGELSPSSVFDWLVDSLEISLRRELVCTIEDYIASYFENDIDVQPGNKTSVLNMIATAREILEGRPIFHKVAAYCQDVLEKKKSIPSDIRLEAAKFLLDSGHIGDDPQFWADIVKDTPEKVTFLPTAVLGLFEKWPAFALDFFLAEAARLSVPEQNTLANFVSLAWEEITSRVTVEEYVSSFLRFGNDLSEDLKTALEGLASLRGWEIERGTVIEGAVITSSALVPFSNSTIGAPTWDNLSDYTRAGLFKDLGAKFAADARFSWREQSRLGQVNAAFPDVQLQALHQIRGRIGENITCSDLGYMELGLVRTSVQQELTEATYGDDLGDGEIMLQAVQERVPACGPSALKAAGCLWDLGFDRQHFNLGETEYHQDRLMMNIVGAALMRSGLMGAQVERRPWESEGFNLCKQHKQANLVMRARPTSRATRSGIFSFEGFRVYLRADGLERYLSNETDDEVIADGRVLLKAVREGNLPREALSVRSRAQLAFRLGLVEARGSIFEDLRVAIGNLAGVRAGGRKIAHDLRNDDAFESFITGRTSIYCGGAINSLLIDTWWIPSAGHNFVEILDHEEIAAGFRSDKQASSRDAHCYMENSLHFNGFGGGGEAARARAAQKALIDLFRVVGQGLQRWARDVTANPHQLNGLGPSCAAARRLLGPEHEAGQYSFVTKLTDPAVLIQKSDKFYRTNGTLPN
jgi:hypothetical protein